MEIAQFPMSPFVRESRNSVAELPILLTTPQEKILPAGILAVDPAQVVQVVFLSVLVLDKVHPVARRDHILVLRKVFQGNLCRSYSMKKNSNKTLYFPRTISTPLR